MPYDAQGYVQVSGPDYRGRVRLQWNDVDIEVRINWGTIKTMQDAWGLDGFMPYVASACDGGDLDALQHLAAICCWHVETDERLKLREIEDWTFPINPLREAIRSSWLYSWHGGEILTEEEDAEEGTEKKLVSRITSLLWPFKRRSKRASQS